MKIKKLIIALVLPLAAGGLSALIAGGMGSFDALVKPPLSPPGWLFPVVWTVLYLLMGYASYRVWIAPAPEKQKKQALAFYLSQLAVNFLWSPVFFGLGWLFVAFAILVALWALIFITANLFSKIDKTASDLLLPYILWVTFAGYLNFAFFLLNR